jgi:hypothetical protein
MEQTTDRRRFLKRVGITLAAGIGLAAFPGHAKAFVNCCQSACDPGYACGPGQVAFWCSCGGPGWDYCVCHDCGVNCYLGPC